jgi:acetolactate synthase-1/2/3 large subunit
VPAAIGAAAARPGDRVVTVSGDGGFSYALGELATHAQLGSRTTHIVLNNGSLGWLAMWQRMFFGGLRQSVDLQTPPPAFAEAARGLGCAGFHADEPSGIGEALDAAFATDGPAVVEVRVDPSATPIHSYRRRLEQGGTHPRPAPSTSCRPGAAVRRALTRRKDLHTVPPECGCRFPADGAPSLRTWGGR